MSLHLHLRRRQCIGILVVISFVAVVLLPAALGVPWSNGEFQEQNPEDYNGLELDENVDHVLQRREWCARWGDSCVPDSKLKFAQCCQGLRCDCGSPLRGTGRCQCKKESVFGR